MRVYAQLCSWFAVDCDDNFTIETLVRSTLNLYNDQNKSINPIKWENILAVKRTESGSMLGTNELVKLVLKSEEKITIDMARPMLQKISNLPMELTIPLETYKIDGDSMTPEDLVALGYGSIKIQLSESSMDKVNRSRSLVEEIIAQNKVVYGINTGFGNFSNVIIDRPHLELLQKSLIRSHASGAGDPMSIERARMMLALRINTLAKGYSGVTLDTLIKLVNAFNARVIPWIPMKGSVGASGDLAPLAHLALGLMGEGKAWSPDTGWEDSAHVLQACRLSPLKLKAKEGLCLINGTQFMAAIGAEALVRSNIIANQADIIAALSLEALQGTTEAFNPAVHNVRPHFGQKKVAARLRSLLHNKQFQSTISENHQFCKKVQDAYSLRCIPQVHGVVHDTIDFVRGILTTEMNSATDNPLVFYESETINSAGNFHGEYPSKALDYLAIAINELANISERRIERLVNPAYSGLPAFLVKEGGLNSGFMLAHVTAAALVSENKVLTHPSSVDSISTSAGQEDHVSMGAFAARKALEVVTNVEIVLAIELLAAVQALEFLRPLRSTKPLEAVVDLIRSSVRHWDTDRFMAPEIETVLKILKNNEVWKCAEHVKSIYLSDQKENDSI